LSKDLADFLLRCLAITVGAFIVVKWAAPPAVLALGTAGGLLLGKQQLPVAMASWIIPVAGGTLAVTGLFVAVKASIYVNHVVRERPSDFATPLLGVFGGFLVDSAEIAPFDGFTGVVLGCITGLLLITAGALLRLPAWQPRSLGIAVGVLPAAFLAACVLKTNKWSFVETARNMSPNTTTMLVLLLVVTVLAYLVSLFVDRRTAA